MRRILVFLTAASLSAIVGAEDLLQLYALAQANDPQLAAARATLDAARESKPIARSQLLPNLSASGDLSYQDQEIKRSISGRSHEDFTARGAGVNVTQPLYRRDRYLQLGQADAQIAQAEADYASAEQNLSLRVTQAYFDVLAAQDNLTFARAEKKAIARELDQAKQRFEVGLIAITGVHEAQARFDQSRADEISAENALDNAWESLREIVGPEAPRELAGLRSEIPLVPPAPTDVDAWSGTAITTNPLVESARQAAEVAQREIEIQRSGHYPTVDLVGSYDINRSEATRGTDSNVAALGVQLAVPLYTGGGVSAVTRQARFTYQAAQEVLDQQRRAVDKQVRNAYRGVESSISRAKALHAATVSAQSALDATTAGFDVGTRTLVDVLNGQRDLFDAKRNYSRARYDYVLNLVSLEQAAGTLDNEDLVQYNAWLNE